MTRQRAGGGATRQAGTPAVLDLQQPARGVSEHTTSHRLRAGGGRARCRMPGACRSGLSSERCDSICTHCHGPWRPRRRAACMMAVSTVLEASREDDGTCHQLQAVCIAPFSRIRVGTCLSGDRPPARQRPHANRSCLDSDPSRPGCPGPRRRPCGVAINTLVD